MRDLLEAKPKSLNKEQLDSFILARHLKGFVTWHHQIAWAHLKNHEQSPHEDSPYTNVTTVSLASQKVTI